MCKLITRSSLLCVSATLAILACGATLRAQQYTIDIPEADIRTGSLSLSQKHQIASAVDYWVSAIAKATDDAATVKARIELLNLFNKYGSSTTGSNFAYRYFFADEAGKKLVAMLGNGPADGSNRQLKEINAALVMSLMTIQSIQEELGAVVVTHPNQGVRYLAWKGYRNIRPKVLENSNDRKIMFALLKKAAAKETSPPVVGMVYRILQIPGTPPSPAVSQEALASARKRAYEIIEATWSKRMQQVLTGPSDMADAARKGVRALLRLGRTMNPNVEQRRRILQMIVDVMYCGAQRYKGLTDDKTGAIVQYTMLLRGSEEALNAMTGQRNRFIETPLTSSRITDRGQAVIYFLDRETLREYGVLKWIETLKGEGIIPPPYKLPADKAPAPTE